ncbi:MAG TPA: HD domain-containing protein [Candidatus Saccharimonadales bacterium]|nr:HD domain-containing protein [Candidatus Saccharimonadales bacterium]
MKPDINRLLEFQKLLLQFQAIQRKVNIPPGLDDTENDVEHSYDIAMLGWYLAPYFPELDVNKVIRFSLAHDIVEVHAGDTYSYGDIGDKVEREELAFKQLAKEWQDFPDLLAAIHEYESRETPEAKFVYALDKLAPALIDYINEGRGWRHLKITAKMFRAEKDRKVPISPEINEYMDQLHDVLAMQLHLFAPEEATEES